MLSLLKRIAAYSVLMFCGVLLSACASQPQPVVSSQNTELEAELAEWKKLKPGVERLVAIESELKGLISSLELIAASEPTARLEAVQDSHNAQTQVIEAVVFEEKAVQQEQPVLARTEQNLLTEQNNQKEQLLQQPVPDRTITVPEPATGAAARKTYSLQLASVTQQSAVGQTWDRLKSRYPKVLAALDLHSEQVQVANKTYYRVKAGRFNSYDEARQNCQLLTSSGASCIVNKG
jgi:hypothetical protein